MAGGDNVYQYVPNPVNWVDPWGLAGKIGDCGPKANQGVAEKHGGTVHNEVIDSRVKDLKSQEGVTNIRKNQQQVDIDGKRTGTNRPDLQFDRDKQHHVIEFDTVPKNSVRHGEVIQGNDPQAMLELNVL